MSDSISRRNLLGLGAATALGAVLGSQETVEAEAKKPGKRSFPISLNTSTLRGHKLPIAKTIDLAAKAGYMGIEPWPDELRKHIESGGKLKDLKKQLDDHGMKVTGAIAFFNWMLDDKGKRAKALDEAKRYMAQLAAIGGTHVAAPPSGPAKEVDKVNLLHAAERYHDLLEASEDSGVIPAVEVWGFRNNLNRLGQAVLVALEANHPKACVLPDVYHLYKGGSGLDGVAFLSGKLLAGFHLNDYPDIPREKIGDGDRVYPGDGVAPLGKFFRDLWNTGYRGPLSIELFNRGYWKQDPALVAKTALEKTKRTMDAAFAS
ncbi:MAG: sugar phosphate isomerase/epimerase family protein [Planctomycetota bacterium]